jgi:hypothetical protein
MIGVAAQGDDRELRPGVTPARASTLKDVR